MLRSEQIDSLAALPDEWRYTLTGGKGSVKQPISAGWNIKGNGLSRDSIELMAEGHKDADSWKIAAATGIGAITGPESGGLLVIDFDGKGDQAEKVFAAHFGRPASDLPSTWTTISGKAGRKKIFLRVTPDQELELNNRSAVWRDEEGLTVLEAIWRNTTGTGRQAVISGTHPSSTKENPLFYRWVNTGSEWATCPDWVAEGVLRQMDNARSVVDATRSGEKDGEPTAYEQLSIPKRWELCANALDSCPTRDGKGSSTYTTVRRAICALLHEWGAPLAELMIAQSKWDSKNNWGPNESATQLLRSLQQSDIPQNEKVTIGSLFRLAQLHSDWIWPDEYKPPKPASAIEKQEIEKLIAQMNFHYQDKTMSALIRGKLSKFYGIRDSEIMTLRLESALGHVVKAEKKAEQAQDVFNGLISRRVHLLAGASHSGKTSLAAFMAGKVLNSEFLTQDDFDFGEDVELPSGPMNCIDIGRIRHSSSKPGKVLVFTSDCSDEDMMRDIAIEGASRTGMDARLKVVSGLGFAQMVEIVLNIQDFEPELVIMDCLSSMALPGISQADAAYAAPIRELVRYNGAKWKKAAFLILHHTTKADPRKSAGTEQIKAASEELLVYYDPHQAAHVGKPGRPKKNVLPNVRHLEFEKSRGGYKGKTIVIERDGMAGRWDWRLYETDPKEMTAFDFLVSSLMNCTDEEWRTPSEWRDRLNAAHISRRMTCRYMAQLSGKILDRQCIPDRRNRVTTHYRIKPEVTHAAKQMLKSNGMGNNFV
jgi:hypothetical protein